MAARLRQVKLCDMPSDIYISIWHMLYNVFINVNVNACTCVLLCILPRRRARSTSETDDYSLIRVDDSTTRTEALL